jgi:Fic family protein
MRVAPAPDLTWADLSPERLALVIGTEVSDEKYLHWDKLRHLQPPGDLTHEEWWIALRFRRKQLYRTLPLTDPQGGPFVYSIPDRVLQALHYVDQRCSGEIAMTEVVIADDQARQHYLVNSLMEEAIRSSQLEGATTSRQAAKELLRSGRAPRDRSEMMIVNNYRALEFMREGMGERLTPAAILELQRILTDGTLRNPDAAGRLQRPDEERVGVYDRNDGKLLYKPPPAEQLDERLELLCDFANDEGEQGFVHPVIRAIILHFWLGYDHPFEDGNGRTARALFYWYMRTHGYWLVEYLSISNILRNAPAKYTRSFLYTETDSRDTTYFLIYQLQVIERAIDELHAYLRRKAKEVRDVENLIRGSVSLNQRQLAVLGDALREPEATYSFNTHAASHNVTHETARSDLRELVRRELLEERLTGRTYVFSPVADLAERLREAA